MNGQQSSVSMDSYGFVYILTNIRMPGLLKVGQTERHPAIRAAELSAHTGVPAPFEVAFYVEVCDRLSAEHLIHSALADRRVGEDREFFEVPFGIAVRVVCSAIFHYVPSTSPFRPYLESLAQEADLCPKCGSRMRPEAFKVHWKCFDCGHSE